MESVADIRRWVERSQTTRTEPKPGAAVPPLPTSHPSDGAVEYIPVQRPPLALICILDDGGVNGEWFRLRGDEWIVGRCEGDVTIAHDAAMSSRHLRLYRTFQDGRHTWHLQDLDSTNGTFVRIASALLRDKQEILVGNRRYAFETEVVPPAPAAPTRNVTQAWQVVKPGAAVPGVPSLVELTPAGDGRRFILSQPENWIGSNASECAVTVNDDPFVSGRHAQISHDERGRWVIRDAQSKNGTWLRIHEITLPASADFQAGEQRFQFKVLTRENPVSG
jgi:pSer/pThr/pTyr-binding forkhead associated (FHA) protein